MPEKHLPGVVRPRGRGRAARKAAAVGVSLAALAAGATTLAGPAAARPQTAPTTAAPGCSTAYSIEQKLTTGTTWRMCWRYDSKAGLVLENISYQPKGEAKPIKVLNSARLGQIHVPYDDGKHEYYDLTGQDFAQELMELSPGECPGGTIKTVKVPDGDPRHPNVKGLCTTTRSRGHAYRMHDLFQSGKTYQQQGKDLLVYTVNQVGWYEYITEWRFQDDGTINMNVGATGSLSFDDYNAQDGRGWPIGKGARDYATSHSHNVFWRLDFGLDGSSKTKVEQYDSTVSAPAGREGPTAKTTRTKVGKELAGDYKTYRWWRVVSATGKNKDGHARSYELVPGPTTKYPGRSFTKHDMYVTEYDKCELFASNNPSCASGHPKSVDKWVGGQALTHPVVWVNVGFHHIARDEDQQPMPVHWQGFSIAPRDVTAMNPLTPKELAWENGHWEWRS